MCSCALRTAGRASYTIQDVFKDDQLVKSISESKVVSKECFTNKHPLSRFQWLWCVAPGKMNDVLAPYKIQLNDYRDIASIAQMAESGMDREKLKISFMELFDKIILTKEELSKTDCIIFC